MTDLSIRPLAKAAELVPLEALQKAIWDAPDSEVVPVHQLVASVHTGGLVLGAFDGEDLVGFAYAFPGVRERFFLYSHMAGVLAPYRRRGVGRALKEAQRAWALEEGYHRIVWTFDPLRAGNASFNLHALGAVGTRYLPDHYGPLEDGLNRGQPSDRMEVEWRLAGPPQLRMVAMELRVQLSLDPGEQDPDTVREALREAFDQGLQAVDFLVVEGVGEYVMGRPG